MVYFFHKTKPRITVTTAENACHGLIIEFEFGQSHQEDGHCHWHKDDARGWADTVINSIDRKILAEVLEQHKIKAVNIQGHGCQVFPSDKKDEWGLPLQRMEIRISFTPQEDVYLNAANRIVDAINWKTSKAAIANVGKYFWYNDLMEEVRSS